MSNKCISCGAEIPEGSIVCYACMHSVPNIHIPTPKYEEQKGETNMEKSELIRKLTSRKFWVAVSQFVVALLIFLQKDKTQAQEIGSLIMLAVAPVAYILGEAWADSGTHISYEGLPADELVELHPPEEIDE